MDISVSSLGSQQTKFIVAYTRPVSSCCSQIAAGGKLKTGCKVEFFEMGINALDLTPGAASIWPSSALKVSGAVCCYDARREETLEGLKNCIGMSLVWGCMCVPPNNLFCPSLLTDYCPYISFCDYSMTAEQLSATSTPIVILACKSDPDAELRVIAAHGNSMGEPCNVGLIEVTIKTHEGKLKMRNAVRWLLYKLEQRQRECNSLNFSGR